MMRSAQRRLAGAVLLALCLTMPGAGRTRAHRHSFASHGSAPSAGAWLRARRWNGYWRRTLPLWGGVYLFTLLGTLSIATCLTRMDRVHSRTQLPRSAGDRDPL